MRQNKYMYQIGDKLYEASFMYARVIEWEIVDILIEEYVSGFKTIVVVKSDLLGTGNKFVSDITQWYDNPDEAEEKLKEKLADCPLWKENMLEG
jgi:hypothetical protein